MKRIKLKQGTLAWETARATRIGSSEVFDLVRYYATDEELQNCGINAEDFKSESPYTTSWALYHKIRDDGLYHKEELAPEFAEYGHAVERYGCRVLNRERDKRLKQGEVFISDRLIASLDLSGWAESIDIRPYDYGTGRPRIGQRFICEQKTMMPVRVKKGLPFKYIIQAQYQILMTNADFYMLQLMILDEDSPFIRGKICQMSPVTKYKYLDNHMSVSHYYFSNNITLAMLIKVCIDRFFDDVDKCNEPTPFIKYDSQKNILESIRINAYFNKDLVLDYDLSEYIITKIHEDSAKEKRQQKLQEIIETAREHHACNFNSPDGFSASFSKDGKFLIRKPKGV